VLWLEMEGNQQTIFNFSSYFQKDWDTNLRKGFWLLLLVLQGVGWRVIEWTRASRCS
jgi:hypothetical protein